MATHSSTCAWKIPWTEEPGWLQSMGSQRLGYEWVISLFCFPILKIFLSPSHTLFFFLKSHDLLLLLFFTLQYYIGCPYINMNLPRVYMCSPSWTPLPPPSPYHPSGSSQCTSPKHPVSCIEPGTGDSFHIWYYTHFNAILPNHPTLALSHRAHKTILYICVSFAVSHTGLSLPSF